MTKGTIAFLCWLVPTVIFYLICSFTQWNIEIAEWSTTCRTIFAILCVASIVYGIIAYNAED